MVGLYVETRIHAPLEVVWRHTQDPALHSRWDLRFTTIEYLPRASDDEPQRFLYATRYRGSFDVEWRSLGSAGPPAHALPRRVESRE